jgi:hypothetical protein
MKGFTGNQPINRENIIIAAFPEKCFLDPMKKNTTHAHNLFRAIRNAKTIDEKKKIVEDYYKRDNHERVKTLRIANGRIYEANKI